MNPSSQLTTGRSRRAGVLLALTIGLASVLLQAAPSLAGSLEWTRQCRDLSASWRWLTGHLVHWSWNHLQWDLTAFALLSFAGLRLQPSRYAACLTLAAALIPLELRLLDGQFISYRGLSGIDSALFGLLVTSLWFHPATSSGRRSPRWLAAIGGCCFLAKTIFELTTGDTVFVANEHHEFAPVIPAHLVGFFAGVFASWVRMGPDARASRVPEIAAGLPLSTWRLRIHDAPR